MTRRAARRQGAVDGADAVETFAQEQGEQAILDARLDGWDEPAINAGCAGLAGVPEHLRQAYYVAYDRAARRTHQRLRSEVKVKVERGEELDSGIYGEPTRAA